MSLRSAQAISVPFCAPTFSLLGRLALITVPDKIISRVKHAKKLPNFADTCPKLARAYETTRLAFFECHTPFLRFMCGKPLIYALLHLKAPAARITVRGALAYHDVARWLRLPACFFAGTPTLCPWRWPRMPGGPVVGALCGYALPPVASIGYALLVCCSWAAALA